MSSFTSIVEGLAANLASIDGVQESAYVLASPTLPAVEITPGPGVYDRTFQRGRDSLELTVRVLVALTADVGAQKRLYAFLDPDGDSSIKQAVESDPTLGGAALDLRVTGWGAPAIFERGGTAALGIEWTVEVWVEGTAG